MHIPPTVFDRLALDADGRISDEIHCFKCGYNLRAQSPAGRCPECAEPVLRTLSGYRLCYSDPAWVRRLANGFKWLEIGAIILLLAMMFVGGSPLYPSARGLTRMARQSWISDDATFYVAASLAIAALGVYAIAGVRGIWAITSAAPDGIHDAVSQRVRVIAQIAAVSGWMMAPFAFPLTFSRGLSASSALGVAWGLVALAGTCTMLQHWRYLAARLPDPALMSQTRFVMIGLTLTAGVKLAAPPLGWILRDAIQGTLVPMLGMRTVYDLLPLYYLVDVLLITFVLWAIFLADLYRRHLVIAARLGAQQRSLEASRGSGS